MAKRDPTPEETLKARLAAAVAKRVGERIQSLRQARKWTRPELGAALGVSEFAIEKYEQGLREPQLYMLQILAEQFNTSIDALFREDVAARKPLPITKIKFTD